MANGKKVTLSPMANALLAFASLCCVVVAVAGTVWSGEHFGRSLQDRSSQSFAVLCGAILCSWLAAIAAAILFLFLCQQVPIPRLALAASEVLRYVRATFRVPNLRR